MLFYTQIYGNKINWGSWCSEEMAKENGWELVNGWPKIPYFGLSVAYVGATVNRGGMQSTQDQVIYRYYT